MIMTLGIVYLGISKSQLHSSKQYILWLPCDRGRRRRASAAATRERRARVAQFDQHVLVQIPIQSRRPRLRRRSGRGGIREKWKRVVFNVQLRVAGHELE